MVVTIRDPMVYESATWRVRALPQQRRIPTWRWLALIAVVAELVHALIRHDTGHDLEAVVGGWAIAFVPSHGVFAAWLVIECALVVYALGALGASQRRVVAHDRVAGWLVGFALLAIVQRELLVIGSRWLFVVLAIGQLVVAALMYRAGQGETDTRRARPWGGIALALALGWTGSMALATLPIPPGVAAAVVVIAGVMLAALGLRHRDLAVTGFAAWLALAIAATNRAESILVAACLVAGAVCVSAAVVTLAASSAPMARRRAAR